MSARVNSLVCCVCLVVNSDVAKLSVVEKNGLKSEVLAAVCGAENLSASLNNVFLICNDCLQDVQRAITLKGRARSSQTKREILAAESKVHFMSQLRLQPKICNTNICNMSGDHNNNTIEVPDVVKSPASSPAKPKKKGRKSSIKARRRFICQICKKNLTSNSGLNNHIENIHNKTVRFFCDYCDKGFYLKSTVARHVKTHGNNTSAAAQESLAPPMFKCWKKLCGEVFNNPKKLSNHYFNHYNTDGRQFVCDCSAIFKKMSNLRRHIRRIHLKPEVYEFM